MMGALRCRLKALRRGAAAVEFALLAPLYCLLFAACIDFGAALHTKLQLDGAVAAGANYAQVNASAVSAANGPNLAANIAQVIVSDKGAPSANGVITVNNGPVATLTGGAVSVGGTASGADACYCPTGNGSNVVFGPAMTCGLPCAGGATAGKFVIITASLPFSPTFSSYGLIQNQTITASAVVQTQ
jgi:Flp pilus assembly protein TadG